MRCAWQAYLNLLPFWMREVTDQFGRDTLQEVRLRLGRAPELISSASVMHLEREIQSEDLQYCVNAASRYSPWSSATVQSGFITGSGGHRLGVCGRAVMVSGKINTLSNITSLCIRVARDFPGIGTEAAKLMESVLIIGSPGRGKTTLLRDIIRQKAERETGSIAVVDERGELFPVVEDRFCFSPGFRTDILSGCGKPDGMQIVIRTMSPKWIAIDEVTSEADCLGLLRAAWCGVKLLATAHAENIEEFLKRPIYRPLVENRVFSNIIVMQADKSWHLERIDK